jgi:hypothetical protein
MNKFESEWASFLTALACIPQENQVRVRRIAGAELSQKFGAKGFGISSSDINHHLFSIWKRGGETLGGFCLALMEIEESLEGVV